MANKNILTDYFKVTQTQQNFYAPVATLPISPYPTVVSPYCFLAKVDPWPNDANPPTPTQDQQYLKSVYKNIFVAKKINSNQISLVIKRVDWSANTVYDYYQDSKNMTQKDSNGNPVYNFYVRNSYNQVFKCLWNNFGVYSTVEPVIEPGTYGNNNIFQGSDMYKWKYMYTIDSGSAKNFMDTNWMPIPINANPGEIYSGETLDPTGPTASEPNNLNAGFGDIEVINVISGGSGYNSANATITVNITGDGFGAAGSAQVSANGTITDIVVTNPGYNYSYANVSISSAQGSGAVVTADASPIGGHAYDCASELGCNHIMYVCEFNGNEETNGINMVPTDITYTQVGLIFNPLSNKTYPYFADQAIYDTTTHFIVAPGFGNYSSDETIYQGSSLATATFTATVLSFDSELNVIYLINTRGTPSLNSPVFGNTSGTVRTLLSNSIPDYINFSGYLAYIENRSGVQRSSDGIEQFKFVLGY
jgi:hypothetical protein